MPFPERLAIASKNPHKLRELGRICRDWPVEWLTVQNHRGPWPDVDEPHDTYLHNALEKARAAAEVLGVPAIADDSGIEVDALDGGPGPRSARFAGEGASDADNLAKLIGLVADMEPDARMARYRCVAAIAWPDGRTMHAEGTCGGTLITRPRGDRGFGYDPIFQPVGLDVTVAELSAQEKNQRSHRGEALRALVRLLRQA